MNTCSCPESLLLHTFGTAIKEAVAAAKGDVSRIAININSRSLQYPIGVPFRPIHQNTPHALLCLFLKYEQSETIASLLDSPVDIEVTTVGTRRGKGKKKDEVIHNVNASYLIEVPFRYSFFLRRPVEDR